MNAPLVLLPGLDGTGELFAPFLAALPAGVDARTVAYPRDRVLPRAGLLDLVHGAAAETPAHVLVAESFSGALAIEYAAARPQGLRALVLVASFVRNPLPRGLRWAAGLAALRVGPWPPPAIGLRKLLFEPATSREMVERLRTTLATVDRSVISDRLDQISRVDASDALARVAVPMLYLAGRRDRLVGTRGLAAILGSRPSVTVRTLDAPHLVLQTRPTEAAREIGSFLESLTEDPVERRR